MGQCRMEPEASLGHKAMSQMKIKGKKKERKKERSWLPPHPRGVWAHPLLSDAITSAQVAQGLFLDMPRVAQGQAGLGIGYSIFWAFLQASGTPPPAPDDAVG